MSRRILSILVFFLGLLSMLGELYDIKFPTAYWFFEISRNVSFLHYQSSTEQFLWFGWLSSSVLQLVGLFLFVKSFLRKTSNKITLQRIQRFKELKRGYYSLLVLMGLVFIAALDQVIVGQDALAVSYEGKWYFPAFSSLSYKGSDFGIKGDEGDAPVNYRKLKVEFSSKKTSSSNHVILPLIPFGSTDDTLSPRSVVLLKREGRYFEKGMGKKAFSGLAAKFYSLEEGRIHLRYTMRNGVLNGSVDGWDSEGNQVYSAEFQNNRKIKEIYMGEGTIDDFLNTVSTDYRAIEYHPASPNAENGNWLGTTSQGYDVLAYLYGGLQINIKAALIFLPIVYFVGISIGMLMGFLGGWFDLVMDRLIEVFSNLPFLFIVIIFSSMVPQSFKGLPIIMSILILFGWMGIAALMRTAAYRDKERDYIAAARVLGASTPRIIFKHLLPNTVAIIVTLVPFTISGLISSLTALDYLGFGLPPEYASWGRLLSDGLSNLSAPWLVSSTFFSLVILLVLITFVGEAVREAFDPKKHSFYR